MYWFGCAKQSWFVAKGWIEPLTDLWKRQNLDEVFNRSAKSAVATREQIYGLPISYYRWGVYYRKSIFRQYNLQQTPVMGRSEDTTDFALGPGGPAGATP